MEIDKEILKKQIECLLHYTDEGDLLLRKIREISVIFKSISERLSIHRDEVCMRGRLSKEDKKSKKFQMEMMSDLIYVGFFITQFEYFYKYYEGYPDQEHCKMLYSAVLEHMDEFNSKNRE